MRLFAFASLAMLVIFFSSTGWGADWKFYTSHMGDPCYYDSQSIRQVSEDIVRVWTKTTAGEETLKRDAEIKMRFNKRYRPITDTLALYEFNCNTKEVRLLTLTMYDKIGVVLFSSSNPGPWGPLNELDDVLLNIVCRPIYELDRVLKEEEKRE
jgi:hypothetical protein